MKTYKAFGKKEMISMTRDEFTEWMKDKTMYNAGRFLSFAELWTNMNYFPGGNFILSNTTPLLQNTRPGYHSSYSFHVEGGESYWNVDHWVASENERTHRIMLTVKRAKETAKIS